MHFNKEKNRLKNCFCEFLLNFLAHSFPLSPGNVFNFYRLAINRVNWYSVGLQMEPDYSITNPWDSLRVFQWHE